ncbi:MAG: hypothetical protein M3548_04455 [Actinomycetota bacterium]|nr:hypothetical protein [Actinomycetota bacterium]
MSDSGDRVELSPSNDEGPGLHRAPYAVLGVAGVVISTVFAAVATFAAGGEADDARSPGVAPVKVTPANSTSTRPRDGSLTATESVPPSDSLAPSTEASTPEEEVTDPDSTTTKKRATTTTTVPGRPNPPVTEPTQPTQTTKTQPPRPPTTTTTKPPPPPPPPTTDPTTTEPDPPTSP